MKLNPYLNFNGQCEEAFKFYERSLGGKIEYMATYAGTPSEQHVPPEQRNKIMHATLLLDGHTLQGADALGPQEAPKGFAVALHLKDPAEAERIFNEFSEGATVQMPLQQTFWAARFGMLVDRFGIPWLFNCEPAS
ncbi:MAG TPA: VOC family protein [Bryobacteraceae bacterium]|jgi:PhnB protein